MSDDAYEQLKTLSFPKEDFRETLRQKLSVMPKKPKTDIDVYNSLTTENPELAAIAMIETSGGKNLKHKLDPKSGMTAGGMFGMMPGTASDVVRLDSTMAKKYPDIVEYTKNLKESHPKITEFFNTNPEAAVEFAMSHYNRAKSKLGDHESTAYGWFNGINGSLKAQKQPGKIANHDYVKKFRQYLKNKPMVAKE